MCELGNLIDLGDEAEAQQPTAEINTSDSKPAWQVAMRKERESFDNNPFDRAQKIANRQDDAFDIVEKEANLKAHNCLEGNPREVELGNLLSLDDEVTDTGHDLATSSGFSLYQTALMSQDLENESPPVSMSLKVTADTDSCEESGSSTDGSTGAPSGGKGKKSISECRKRLLKLSISNSTFNSPVALVSQQLHCARRGVFPASDSCCSPISSLFASAMQPTDYMLAAESPLKLVEDDLLTEEVPNFLDSEKDFDVDLEKMKIPILQTLHSPRVELRQPAPTIVDDTQPPSSYDNSETLSTVSALPNFDSLRSKLNARLNAKHHENLAAISEDANGNAQDITELLKNLKTLICDIDVIDDTKKQRASSLLETLSSALVVSEQQCASSAPARQPSLMRQSTFNIEPEVESAIEETTAPNPIFDGIPEAMVASSATYDGETAEEKAHLQLPEVDPVYAMAPQAQVAQPDMHDLVEQLSKLLEQHNLGSNSHHNATSSDYNQTQDVHQTTALNGTLNPTFIVVMPGGGTALPSYMTGTPHHGSPENYSARRRSQSLSLHDKVKILQLPMQPPSQIMTPSTESDETSPVNTPPDSAEFKTPMQARPRRNSFSSGTPYTPIIPRNQYLASARRSHFGLDMNPKPIGYVRHSAALSTHMEQQQQAIVRPMTLPTQSSFRPDLKKKQKLGSATDSIMKSSGPLKATIPVKKVAPMLKVPSDEDTSNSYLNRSTLGGYPTACSTPQVYGTPQRRTSGAMQKSRYSHIAPSTPNTARAAAATSNNSFLRKRSPAELKIKSPAKTRHSVGLAASNTVTRLAANRLNPRQPPPSVGRINSRPASISTTSRVVTNRAGLRTSLGGATTPANFKNKENKQP